MLFLFFSTQNITSLKMPLPLTILCVNILFVNLVQPFHGLFLVRAFKALKQTVKIYFRLGNDKKMLDAYREMLTYFKPALLWYYGERSITNILHLVATSATARQHSELLPEFYQTTLNAFDETKNQVWRLFLFFCISLLFLLNGSEMWHIRFFRRDSGSRRI